MVVQQLIGHVPGFSLPAALAGELTQSHQRIDQCRQIVGHRPMGGLRSLGRPRTVPAAVPPQVFQEELGGAHGSVAPAGLIHGGGRLGQRCDDQGVPLHEHLVVQTRLGPVATNLQQTGTNLVENPIALGFVEMPDPVGIDRPSKFPAAVIPQ